MNIHQQNFHPNSSISNELRQVHRQLIRTDIDPKIIALMETAILREKVARDNIIMEKIDVQMPNCEKMEKANDEEMEEMHRNGGENDISDLGGLLNEENDWPKTNQSQEIKEEEQQIDEEMDEEEEEMKMEDKNIEVEEVEEKEMAVDVENSSSSAEAGMLAAKSPILDLGLPIDVAEWRRLYEAELAKKYGSHNRIRFLFCRRLHSCYLEKLRQINRIPAEILTVNEKRFMRKFDIEADLLVDRGTRKPYICYEDFFSVIYNAHIQSESGEMREIFNNLKNKYANITLLSIQIYWKIRYQLLKRESYARSIRLIYNVVH